MVTVAWGRCSLFPCSRSCLTAVLCSLPTVLAWSGEAGEGCFWSKISKRWEITFCGLNFQALRKIEVTKHNVSLHASLQKQMLPRNILCSLVLKLNVMDIKLYDLPVSMVQLFQGAGSLELKRQRREWMMLPLVQLFLFKEISAESNSQLCKYWKNRNSHFRDPE